MSPHYTNREEPNADAMQQQVAELGWSMSPPNPEGRSAVYNRNGELKGVFTPDEWFPYIERRLEEHQQGQQAASHER